MEALQGHFRDRYEVHTASCEADALALLELHDPDVVLLDINIPGMNGVHVLKLIKRTRHSIPVIIITASSDTALAADAISNGALSYTPKPLNVRYVEHLISIALDQRART